MRVGRGVVVVLAGAIALRLAWSAGMDRLFDPILLSEAYLKACETAGVRILKRPASEARSVFLSYKPSAPGNAFRRYEFDPAGRLTSAGSVFWQPRLEDHMELVEEQSPYGAQRPDLAVVRYRRGEKPALVATPASEYQVADSIEGHEEHQKALWQQGVVIHRLQVKEVRSGESLAEMVYVLDLSRNRGCGQNVKNAIDVDAFVMDALSVPIKVPDWERKRREAAWVKNW